MTLQQIKSFATQLHTIVANADEMQSQIDKMTGAMHVAKRCGDTEQASQLNAGIQHLTAQLSAVTDLALERSNRKDIEGARDLVSDISVRIDRAMQSYQEQRARMADFEHRAAYVTPDWDRATAEQELEEGQDDVRRWLKEAEALVPNRRIIIGA